ncbi:hypothetical protein [Phytoactinopolyspora limicola]|uniref:hypothetical protein n=1 Tax=Phytoactinopolyspora limicola TaxID=2715536 RepID=UPI00140BB854|nr:hypothetical protein [Phytoactinopolyspora limicola]
MPRRASSEPVRSRVLSAFAVLAVFGLAACSGDDAIEFDLHSAAHQLAEDGAAVVAALQAPAMVDSRDQRLIHDATLDEQCGDGGFRRVWRTDLVLILAAGDASDARQVNREFDHLYVGINAELGERGYSNPVWWDSDTDAPDWNVFYRTPGSDGDEAAEADDTGPLEIRTTFQLAPEQPADAMAIQVDVIGSTGCGTS